MQEDEEGAKKNRKAQLEQIRKTRLKYKNEIMRNQENGEEEERYEG